MAQIHIDIPRRSLTGRPMLSRVGPFLPIVLLGLWVMLRAVA